MSQGPWCGNGEELESGEVGLAFEGNTGVWENNVRFAARGVGHLMLFEAGAECSFELRETGAFYVMDRGYVDFEHLYSHSVDKNTGVRSDHTVILTAIGSAEAYPEALRRVSYLDVDTRK